MIRYAYIQIKRLAVNNNYITLDVFGTVKGGEFEGLQITGIIGKVLFYQKILSIT